jgi:glycosyltransferase involved in cell wall biosynthesis
VLVPSRDASERLVEAGWDGGRLVVWPRGVDATLFSPERRSESLREKWSVSDKRPAILYAGRLTREKGVSMLDQIGSQLYRRRRAHRFVIAGDGPLRDDLRHAIPDAVFLGQLPQDQLAAAMASADVVVSPGDAGTGGSVVLEAQACGVPVVVSAAGGASENVIDGESGFVCRPSDHVAFATGIEQLLADRAHRRAIGAGARKFAAGRSWQVATSVLYTSYRAAIAAATDPSGVRPARPRLVSARLRR